MQPCRFLLPFPYSAQQHWGILQHICTYMFRISIIGIICQFPGFASTSTQSTSTPTLAGIYKSHGNTEGFSVHTENAVPVKGPAPLRLIPGRVLRVLRVLRVAEGAAEGAERGGEAGEVGWSWDHHDSFRWKILLIVYLSATAFHHVQCRPKASCYTTRTHPQTQTRTQTQTQ